MKKHLTISNEVTEEIKKIAKKEEKSFSMVVELAIRYYLREVKGVEVNWNI